MKIRLVFTCYILILFPVLFVAQTKKTNKAGDRLEIVGKWFSYSSLDSTKKEVCEFKPDGSFVEYKNWVVKNKNTKYVLYKDELTMLGSTNETHVTMKFRVKKETYGLSLQTISINSKNGPKDSWVKLIPWKP